MDKLQTWLRQRRVLQQVPVTGYQHYIERPIRRIELAPELLPTRVDTPPIVPPARAPISVRVQQATVSARSSAVAASYPIPVAPPPARAPLKNEPYDNC
jgi:hypothetical protein